MDILKHDPLTFFVCKIKFLWCHDILSLTKRNKMKLLDRVDSNRASKSFDILDRVSTWWQNEVDWSCVSGITVGTLEHLDRAACRVTVYESIAIRQGDSNEIVEGDIASIWSQASYDKELLEWHWVKRSPIKRKSLCLWVLVIVPIFESFWCVLGKILGKALKAFDFDKLLDCIPICVWQPLFEWVWHCSGGWTVDEEAEFLICILNLDNSFRHQTESELSKEDLFVLLEKSSGNPLVDCHSDNFNKGLDTFFFFLHILSLFDSFEEECCKWLKGVLIHEVNDAKLDKQEV